MKRGGAGKRAAHLRIGRKKTALSGAAGRPVAPQEQLSFSVGAASPQELQG